MKIHQIYTDSQLRNFTYILELNNKSAYVIDPWNDDIVNNLLKKEKLTLTAIINTHEHWDHTQGNNALVNQHQCEVWAHSNGAGKVPGLSRMLLSNEKIELEQDVIIEVLDTPGHCQAHLCFIVYHHNCPTHIFTGDILFNAGVGNCHDGDVSDMYETIQEKFTSLPDDIIILPGHEYLKNNLNFTLSREPSNKTARLWLDKHKKSDIYSCPLTTTMGDERKINTFFRLENKEIIENLPNKYTDKDYCKKDVFISLRTLRDDW
jgi:hydroxyacylglutathione hydrolase